MTCSSGKIAYKSRRVAATALSRIVSDVHKRRGEGPYPVEYYRCPECKKYHLTKGSEYQPRTTRTEVAKGYVGALIGEPEAQAPKAQGQKRGRPYFHYFASMDEISARLEYEQVAQLPEHMRERDLIERMGLDGRREALREVTQISQELGLYD